MRVRHTGMAEQQVSQNAERPTRMLPLSVLPSSSAMDGRMDGWREGRGRVRVGTAVGVEQTREGKRAAKANRRRRRLTWDESETPEPCRVHRIAILSSTAVQVLSPNCRPALLVRVPKILPQVMGTELKKDTNTNSYIYIQTTDHHRRHHHSIVIN
jgi:hypothetical protein